MAKDKNFKGRRKSMENVSSKSKQGGLDIIRENLDEGQHLKVFF